MYVRRDPAAPGLTVRVVRFPTPASVVQPRPVRDRRKCGYQLANGQLCKRPRSRGRVACWQHGKG